MATMPGSGSGDLWKWLVDQGAISGDPTYYSSGKAQPDEVKHAVQTAVNFFQQNPEQSQSFYQMLESSGLIQGDPTYYSSGAAAPAEFTHLVDVVSSSITAGSSTTINRVYGGGQWIKVGDPSGTDAAAKWVAVYTLPGSNLQVFFEATQAELNSIFGAGKTPSSFSTMSQQQFDNLENMFFGGGVSEAFTPSGESFVSAYERSVAAGLGTTVIPPEMRNDPVINGLVFLAEHEGWSDTKLLEEISTKSEVFQARYPELKVFQNLGLGVVDAVKAYNEYENKVKALTLQYEGREATSSEINGLIGRQHSMELIEQTFQVFDRFEQNERALGAFNSVLAANGLEPLDADGMFDFLSGKGAPELYDLYAQSSLLEGAQAAGLEDFFGAADARELQGLMGTGIDFTNTYGAMTRAATDILRFRREIDLGAYGLEADDLIDLSLGQAPRSGKTAAELAETMSRVVIEAKGFLDKKASPFFQFSRQGEPQAVSLSRLKSSSV